MNLFAFRKDTEKSSDLLFSRNYLAKLILPLVAEQFLAMTIGACDQVMVSSIGEAGISGVSLVDQFSQLMIQLFAAFATGGAVVSSQYLGHKSPEKARLAAKQLMNISLFVSFLFVALCLPFRVWLLRAVYGKVGKDVMASALTYFVWTVLSFPFLAVYNSSAALFRSMGNSKLSLKVSIFMNILNIVGNAVLIYGAKIGIAGAGISTLVSRAGGAIVLFAFLCKKNDSDVYLENIQKPEINIPMIRRILSVGVPSGIENSVFHIGKTLVQAFLSGFGTAAIAANAITNTVASFSNIPGNAIGLGSVTVVGQCIGADKKKQAVQYGSLLMKITYLSMFAVSTLIFIFTPFLVGLFKLSDEARVLASGITRTCMIANSVLWPMAFTMPNVLRAAGDVKFTMIVSNISMWAFRVLFSYLISHYILLCKPSASHLALYGVWFGMYLDWIFRGALFFIRFKNRKWLDKKII